MNNWMNDFLMTMTMNDIVAYTHISSVYQLESRKLQGDTKSSAPPLPSPLNIAAVTAATDVIDLLVYSTVGEHVESLMKTLSNLTSFSPWLKRSDLPIGAGRLLAHEGSVGRTPFLLQLNHDMYRR